MDHDEELARLRAEVDQAQAGMEEFAGTAWTFFTALRDEGFDDAQAMRLTVAWLSATVGSALGGADE